MSHTVGPKSIYVDNEIGASVAPLLIGTPNKPGPETVNEEQSIDCRIATSEKPKWKEMTLHPTHETFNTEQEATGVSVFTLKKPQLREMLFTPKL
jgi:hypothetical protein